MSYTDEFGNIYEDDSLSGVDANTYYEPDVQELIDYSGYNYGYTQNEDGSSQRANGDGSITYVDPDGQSYTVNPTGTYTTSFAGENYTYDPGKNGFVDAAGKLIEGGVNSSVAGKSLLDKIKGAITKNPFATGITAAAAIKSLMDRNSQSGGYNKPVPKMDMVRQQVAYDDANRRPGEAGRRYFTNPLFVAQGDAENLAAAQTASNTQATGLAAAAPTYAAPRPNPYAGTIPTKFNPTPPATSGTSTPAEGLAAVITPEQFAAQGGIKMAQGGIAEAGRYLQGKTDGMADEISTSIDGEQPAALSHGEFVIPADVVSHLGNGNSEAGAEKLYEMMARIRKARTGNEKQGKEINAEEFTMGGLTAAYAGGGAVKGFDGTTGSIVTGTSAGGVPLDTSKTSTLSPWVGDYVTNALGQGAALANAPYQAYQGPLTAGASNLQQQAFAGASDLATAGYTPGTFTGGFGTTQANQYMNPYLQASLDPQLKELQRQSDIQRVADAGRLTSAGAYGGGRQAIMESEGRRNLLDKQAGLIGAGYKSAYDTGLGQFNKEREAEEASRQFSAKYGMDTVKNLADLGETERGITAEGLAADKKQFEDERDFAYKMPQYQLGLLQGLPIGANTTAVNQDAISKLSSDVSGLASLYQKLANLGVK
jgi:hypothetical protein